MHAEIFLRDKNTPLDTFKTEAAWKQDVDMLVDVGSRGKVAWTTTKMWNVSSTATQVQIDRWHKYALASFLLGTNGHSYFNFSAKNTVAGVFVDHPWDRVQVGDPVGQYAKVGGVYRRDFTAGMALVNPTTAPITVNLWGHLPRPQRRPAVVHHSGGEPGVRYLTKPEDCAGGVDSS